MQTAANPVVKISQAKKHPLTRGESLPTAKRKKMGKYRVAVIILFFCSYLRLAWLVFAKTQTDNAYCGIIVMFRNRVFSEDPDITKR